MFKYRIFCVFVWMTLYAITISDFQAKMLENQFCINPTFTIYSIKFSSNEIVKFKTAPINCRCLPNCQILLGKLDCIIPLKKSTITVQLIQNKIIAGYCRLSRISKYHSRQNAIKTSTLQCIISQTYKLNLI